MAHYHVRIEAVLAQQLVECGIDRQHGRLGDGGLHQVALGLLHGGRIVAVYKDVAGQRTSQNRRHHLVGLGEGLGDDRLQRGQFAAHVGILAALAGEEEGDLARAGRPRPYGAAAAEDPLRAQRLPCGGIVEAGCFACLGQPVVQFGMVAEVDDQPLAGVQVGLGRCFHRRRPATLHLLPGCVQSILQRHRRVRAQRQNAADWFLGGRQVRSRQGNKSRSAVAACPSVHLSTCFPVWVSACFSFHIYTGIRCAFCLQHAGHVLLQHDVEIGAAKTVRADAGTAGDRSVSLRPLPKFVVDSEGGVGEINVRVWFLSMKRGRK